MQEVLIVIASVSAVLWTGGLIVRQIRQDAPEPQRYAIDAGMAATAFGALAPLFALLASECALRLIALAAGLLYLAKTWGNLPNAFRALGKGNSLALLTALGFFLPTLGMLLVVVFPMSEVIAWEGAVLDFLGYYILSEAVRIPPGIGLH